MIEYIVWLLFLRSWLIAARPCFYASTLSARRTSVRPSVCIEDFIAVHTRPWQSCGTCRLGDEIWRGLL